MALTQRKIAGHIGNLKAQAAEIRANIAQCRDGQGIVAVNTVTLGRMAALLDEVAGDLLTALPDTHALAIPADDLTPMPDLPTVECKEHGHQIAANVDGIEMCSVCLSLAEMASGGGEGA